jgi:cell division protein FtsB
MKYVVASQKYLYSFVPCLVKNRNMKMIKLRIKQLEQQIKNLQDEEWNYITRITLEQYYHHLHNLYQEYNKENW